MNLTKLPSGTWRVQVKHQGERRTATAPTRGQAQRLGAELLLELGGGGQRAERNVTVADMLSAHLAEQHGVWSPTYEVDVTRVIDKAAIDAPAFYARRVRDVTPAVLVALYRQLERAGWTPWRVRRLHVAFGTAWRMGIRYGWVHANPCPDAVPDTPPSPELTLPTDEQVRAILANLTGAEWLAVRLNATLGIRRGDLVGLQWGDVDFDRGEILIARSLAYVPGEVHVRPTKSGKRSHRRLAVDLPTATALKRWKAEQALRTREPAVWVFSVDGGHTPWRPDRVTRLFRTVADRSGAQGVRLHDLRHYVATQMLNDGQSAHDVAGQLGNTPAVVESTYRHWLPGRGRESVDRRSARLDGTG